MATEPGVSEITVTPRRLRFDSFLVLINQAGVGALSFVASVAVARTLGPAGRGAVAVALVLVVLFVQLGSLGVATASPYFAARDSRLGSLLTTVALWLAAIAGLLLAGLLFALRWIAPSFFTDLTWAQVAVIALVLPVALASIFLQSILLGQGRTIAYNGVQLGFALLSTVSLLAVALLGHLTTTLAIALLVTQYPLSCAVFGYLLTRRSSLRARPSAKLIKQLLRFGLRSYAATVLSFLVIRLDLVLVNHYLGDRQAGLYSVAVVIAQAMYVFPVAVGLNLLPRVARGASASDTARAFRVVALLYGGMCVAIGVVAAPVIHLFFGSKFGGSVPMFYWLLPGVYSLGMLVILGGHLAGRGYPTRATIIWASGLAFNVVANVILLPRYGTYMASIVSSVTYTAVLALHVHLFLSISEGDVGLWPRLAELRLVMNRNRPLPEEAPKR